MESIFFMVDPPKPRPRYKPVLPSAVVHFEVSNPEMLRVALRVGLAEVSLMMLYYNLYCLEASSETSLTEVVFWAITATVDAATRKTACLILRYLFV